MADKSRLPEIIDAAAAIGYQYVPAVRSCYGAGSGLVTIGGSKPFAGILVPPWPGNTAEPGELVALVSSFVQQTKSRTVTFTTFQIGLRYYVNRNDLASAMQQLAGILGPIQTAFSQHTSLLGTVPSGHALMKGGQLVVPSGGTDAWILFNLEAVERLDLDNQP